MQVGLALGSGGARGWAHIGVIRALEDAGIAIDCVAGTSIGAFVGAIYAGGSLDDLEAFVREIEWRTIVSLLDVEFPTRGLLDGEKIYELISTHLLDTRLEDTRIPFACVATDLQSKQAVILNTGSMVDAVRASISIPGVFTPFKMGESYLVDGGVVNPVPVDVLQGMGADRVIAVNLNHPYSDETESDAPTYESPDTYDLDIQTTASEQSEGQAREQKFEWLENVKSRYELVRESLETKIENWMPQQPEGPNIFDAIGTAMNIMEQQVTKVNLEIYSPDSLIEPNLSQVGIFDFHRAQSTIREGYRRTEQMIPEIEKLLA